ncbi:MAG TPA: ATP-dependent DNA helicase RecQ [Anaeromyxobacteraceae bacterium]|nr:ATP-dependent DNA helicase RecQ [Anaeromyxobacteraceae bacterium]
MGLHPEVAALLAAWREPPADDAELRQRISATVAALRSLRRDRPELFETEAARLVRPAEPGPERSALAAAAAPPADPAECLRRVFGFEGFRPGQRELVDAVLAGRDAIGVLPTGSGKSLTYQLPARMMGGLTLVVSPLIALMKDQVDAMARLGVRATFLNSSLDPEERRRRVAGLRRGEYEIVYAAPEGLEASVGAVLEGTRLSLVAVDEAHCISHWGHDFRPAYRNLAGLRARFGGAPVLALTATATRRVASDIAEQLRMRDPVEFRGSFFRPNLLLRAAKKGPEGVSSREAVLACVRGHRGESGIVYCIARRSVESLAEFLRSKLVRAVAYHAGLEPEERERVQDAFREGAADVVVATVAFGMGIDKPDIRFVIHRDMPGSVEGYCQEIGRAGRDGQPSDCLLLYSYADVMAHDRLAEAADDPDVARAQREQARRMLDLAEASGCRHRLLARHFDETIDPCGESCDRCRPDLGRGAQPVGARGGEGVRALASAPGAGAAPFERLRAWRSREARERGVPPFLVFPDATLRAIAEAHPRSLADLAAVKGVGPAKLAGFGEAVLGALGPRAGAA